MRPLPHHQRDATALGNTLLTSFGRQPYFVEHDSSLRLLFLILESELLNAKHIYSKWSHWAFHQLCPPNGLKDHLPVALQKGGRQHVQLLPNARLCSPGSQRQHLWDRAELGVEALE